MKRNILIIVCAFAVVTGTQCSLTERLAKVGKKISSIKADIQSGKGEVVRTCDQCKNG